jgi:C4-dicarboxylate-specific signal transduction histidine kinase
VDLRELIREVRQFLEPEFQLAGIEVLLELGASPLLACVDSIQIEQVLVNLLRNGIEALAQIDGVRGLQISARRGADDLAEIVVRDNGPGVPPELRDQVFEPFFTTKGEGLGMGLAIGQTIVAGHGGKLLLCPAGEERGASFRLQLPLSR